MQLKNSFKDLIHDSSSRFGAIKNGLRQIGPYHSYDMKLFEILPSNKVENKNNRIILDSFANLVCDGFWKPIVQGRCPLGLEVFGDGENTTFHVLLPKDNIEFMIGKIYSCFNGSTIHRLSGREDYMGQFNNIGISDIYKLDIRNHPFMPFNMGLIPVGNTLAESMEYLDKGERACVQVLLQPIDSDWQNRLRYAYDKYLLSHRQPPFGTNPLRYAIHWIDCLIEFIGAIFRRDDNFIDSNYHAPKITDREFNKDVTNKLASTGFRASIKITVQSPDKNKRATISKAIASSFTQMNKYNEFYFKKFLRQGKALNEFKERKMCFGDDFMITSAEACNMLNIPDTTAQVTKLKKAVPNEELVDPKVSEGNFYIGETLPYKNKVMKVCMATKSFNEINKTFVVLAPPGFGKTTIAERMAYECMKNEFGFLAIDTADGKMAIRIIKIQEMQHDRKLIYLDFTDLMNLPQLSPSIIYGNAETKAVLFDEWFEQMLNLSGNAPRAKVFLRKFTSSCFSADENNGLAELKMLIDCDKDMITKTMESLKKKNPALYLWWLKEYSKAPDKIRDMLEPVRVRLDDILENSLLRSVFANNKSNIDIRKWMDEGYGVVVNLAENNVITKMHQQAITSFLFLAFWSATKSRADLTNKNILPRPFKLLLDEPYTYLHCTETIEEAMNKFRKYGVSVNIFMHGVEQILETSKKLWDSILISQPNFMLGAVSDKTIKNIRSKLALTDEALNDLLAKVQNRDDHYFILSMSFDKGLVPPFVFHSALDLKEKGEKKAVIKRSRELYAPNTMEELDDIYFAKGFKMSLSDYKKLIRGDNDNEDMKGESSWEESDEEEVKEIQSGI